MKALTTVELSTVSPTVMLIVMVVDQCRRIYSQEPEFLIQCYHYLADMYSLGV